MSDSVTEFDGQDDELESNAIAVVGMACHFPGAENLDAFWSNLKGGVESVHRFTREELLEAGEDPQLLSDPNYVAAQPILKGFDRFDAKFWGFNPQDAAVTDPAHRRFLEVSHHALEHAGHTGLDEEGTVGVFASSGASQYWMQNLLSNPELMESMGEFLVRHTGNDMNFLATRLSYELDLKGPSINIQTACSSALVAIHYAAASLLSEECDLALAGASTVLLPQGRGYLYRDGEILSPDGHCRPFDAQSAGTIFGSGAGCVVLRRLEDAIADGDDIHAIVRGSAINNDGAQKIGFLAPGVDGQAAAITEALELSGVEASEVGYVEAHGTGTLVGDPIEMEALKQAFSAAPQQPGSCLVGSVKSNVGHLGEAAGIAAFIKAVLATKHAQIPPTPNFQTPNPEMEIEHSRFSISTELTDWQPADGQRICGITALGAGGTNAHVIIEQGPEKATTTLARQRLRPILLSAKSENALNAMTTQLRDHLTKDIGADLNDVAYTLAIGRRGYPHRRAIVAQNAADTVELIESGQWITRTATASTPQLVFMFPGGGAQYAGMGASLYHSERVYAEAFDLALSAIPQDEAADVRRLVIDTASLQETERNQATRDLERPSRSLVSIFATEYALANLLEHWGANPDVLVGHSMGEYTAACLAGVMTVADAMTLIRKRGLLFERAPAGGMVSISQSVDTVRKYLPKGLDIAAINAPDLCVASGPLEQISELLELLQTNAVEHTRIHIEVAAHSSMLNEIVEEFRDFCQGISLSPPQKPFTSNLTGTWITPEQAVSADYWADHLRNTVLFAENVATVTASRPSVVVEVGPGRTLSSLCKACNVPSDAAYNAMRHPGDDTNDEAVALQTLANLWASGALIDWPHHWREHKPKRTPLPVYPFQSQRYWVDPGSASKAADKLPGMTKRPDLGDWFGMPAWSQSGFGRICEQSVSQWLLFAGSPEHARTLTARLPNSDSAPVVVLPGEQGFAELSDNVYRVDPTDQTHFEKLFEALGKRGVQPTNILYAWALPEAEPRFDVDQTADLAGIDLTIRHSFWGLFGLSKVLCDIDFEVTLNILTRNLWAFGDHAGAPLSSPVLGPATVLPREAPHVQTRTIDLHQSKTDAQASALTRELASLPKDPQVLLHNSQRWIRSIVDSYEDSVAGQEPWVRDAGTYLISGGLGGIGLAVAKHLAKQGAARIALLSRSGLPPSSTWLELLRAPNTDVLLKERIVAVREIEAYGAQVVILTADICDPSAVTGALASFSPLEEVHGVVHAAGAMDDQLVMVKSAESARRILDAKVRGAIVLDQLFAGHSLDYFLLFSSIASYMGLPGQIDYTSANAFLDSLAHERASRTDGFTGVVNWNAWREVGMAANSAEVAVIESTANRAISALHPALFAATTSRDAAQIYGGELSVHKHWFVAEHQLSGGGALLPGTGILELAMAVLGDQPRSVAIADSVLELTDLRFIESLQVPSGSTLSFGITIAGNPDAFDIALYEQDEETPNCTATGRLSSGVAPVLDLAALNARCINAQPTAGRFMQQDFMAFGLRWGCIDAISTNSANNEALLRLSLDASLVDDLGKHPLHPGLLDMATGSAQCLIPEFDAADDFYVPFAYERVRMYAGLSDSIYSHVRCTSTAGDAFARFDISVSDASGGVLLEIEGFTMKRLEAHSAIATSDARATHAVATTPFGALTLNDILTHAMTPQEGVAALDRMMHSKERCQWVISSVDTNVWKQALERDAASGEAGADSITFVHSDAAVDPDANPLIPAAEAALRELPDIDELIVRCFGYTAGPVRYVAFVAPAPGFEVPSRTALNAALGKLKLDVTIDSVQAVATWPSDRQDQIDRAALADPSSQEGHFEAPVGETQEKLAELWCALLGAPRVGASDHFFELGGHSLLLTRLIARVQKSFGRKLPLEAAYENPTIIAWAELLDSASKDQAAPAVGIRRANRSRFKMEE